MADKRMFSKTIIDSDAFLDMPITARLLYYDLSMRADDDGFVNSPKKIMRIVGASPDDVKILCAKKFIIPFENGVVVIKHWRIHNYIRKDTYKETPYKEQKALLELDENNGYRIAKDIRHEPVDEPLNIRHEPVDEPSTQDRIGKDRLGKDRIEKDIDTPSATQQDKPVGIERPKTKPRKKEELMTVYYPNDEILNKAFADFVETRNQGKHPFRTNRAIELAINKLNKLSGGDNNLAIEIIEQSIIRGWESFYELPTQKAKPVNNANRSLYADLDEWLAKKEQEEEEKRQNGV